MQLTMAIRTAISRPSGFLPIVMSVLALFVVILRLAILLGDRHHAAPHSVAFSRRMRTPLTDRSQALQSAGVEVGRVLPHERTQFSPDLEAIPTPGHTRGAFSYLWTNRKKRYLFIGDTLVPEKGQWQIYVTRPNREEMLRTVNELAKLDFDVILSNSFAALPAAWFEVTAKSRKKIFDEVRKTLAD
jgi:glyoxylase-like metal-dependent hydrolase (beta-lactamase superfamily II)